MKLQKLRLQNLLTKLPLQVNLLEGALGPLADTTEIAIEGGIALNKTLQTGVPLKTSFC